MPQRASGLVGAIVLALATLLGAGRATAASGCELAVAAAPGSPIARPVDMVIPTKFPTYFARHPAKVAWLVHQHRAAYELCGTPFSDFDHTERDVALRKRLVDLDTRMLSECAGLFTIEEARHLPVVADALAANPRISRVLYPGRPDHPQHKLAASQMSNFGGVVTFDVKGGKNACFEALNRLKIVDISNNLGDAKSLITHPSTTTHRSVGEEERLAIGLTGMGGGVLLTPIMVLLMINILLLILGTLMDMAPLILIMTPILMPVVKS